MHSTLDTLDVPSLRQRWERYKQENRRAFMYDAAEVFGVREETLLSAYCGDTVTRLAGEWPAILQCFSGLGEVMALTRNPWAVIEKRGQYSQMRFQGNTGIVFDPGIDLRLFLGGWESAYALEHPGAPKYRYSFQFFNRDGVAVHKTFMEAACEDGFLVVRESFRAGDQTPVGKLAGTDASAPANPQSVDAPALEKEWAQLQDTHDFHPLLKKYGLQRTAAYRAVSSRFAERLQPRAYHHLLKQTAELQTPIMVFVGNPGCIEIHTGEIHKIVQMDTWFNIMDPGFTLHLNEEGVAECWLVRKPTKDGIVTSVELYDRQGQEIAYFFGKRKPGQPEREDWRMLAESTERMIHG